MKVKDIDDLYVKVKYPDSGILFMASRYGRTISSPVWDSCGQVWIVVEWEPSGSASSCVSLERIERLELDGRT